MLVLFCSSRKWHNIPLLEKFVTVKDKNITHWQAKETQIPRDLQTTTWFLVARALHFSWSGHYHDVCVSWVIHSYWCHSHSLCCYPLITSAFHCDTQKFCSHPGSWIQKLPYQRVHQMEIISFLKTKMPDASKYSRHKYAQQCPHIHRLDIHEFPTCQAVRTAHWMVPIRPTSERSPKYKMHVKRCTGILYHYTGNKSSV